jgi:hypothetical protein
VALIAYGISKGREFRPDKSPPWLLQGWAWQTHLPWAREQKAYEARPECSVDRDWFRVTVKKLRELADSAGEADLALFEFDGEVLKISVCDYMLAMPAKGKPWKGPYAISAKTLAFLPKRLVDTAINLSVWDGYISIGRRRWHLASND